MACGSEEEHFIIDACLDGIQEGGLAVIPAANNYGDTFPATTAVDNLYRHSRVVSWNRAFIGICSDPNASDRHNTNLVSSPDEPRRLNKITLSPLPYTGIKGESTTGQYMKQTDSHAYFNKLL
jgi:hypothetical protein